MNGVGIFYIFFYHVPLYNIKAVGYPNMCMLARVLYSCSFSLFDGLIFSVKQKLFSFRLGFKKKKGIDGLQGLIRQENLLEI